MVAHREFFSCHPSPPRLHFTETTGLAIQFLPVEADWRPQRNVSPRVWRGCAAMHRSIKEAGAISDGLGFPPPQELSEFNPSRSALATGFRLGVYLLQLLCCAVPNCRSIGKPGPAAEAATRIGPLPPEPPGIPSELRRAIPKRGAHRHGICGIDGEPSREPTDGEASTDARDGSRGPPVTESTKKSGVRRCDVVWRNG